MPAPSQPFAPVVGERRSSLSSKHGSHRSSASVSRSLSHRQAPSQHSLGLQSPQGSFVSSQKVYTPAENGVRRRRHPRVKSQYPLDDSEPHVEYILVASFDVDRGPTMLHQVPGAISPDENMLAELMLPDQTHMRPQDWTMFFLHKDGAAAEDAAERRELRRQMRELREQQRQAGEDVDGESSSDEDSDDGLDGPPLMYVLNLVNTKHDPNEKRGAKTQAMAICTRHTFLHIYKPLLLLALEDYFKNPGQEVLENLYNSLNAMDISLMPRLSLLERHVLQANDVRDLFVEKYEAMIEQRLEDEAAARTDSPPESPSRNKYVTPRDTHEFESKIIYNDIPIPVKIPTAPASETVGDFSLIQLVQTFTTPHVTQPQPFALHPHLTTAGAFTHPIIVLINAMLTEKRVIFLGHNRPSGEVAEAVLAACALTSGGILRGFTRHAFPYTDLSKIDDLLKVPGFIAGVTNPAFSYHPEWWDLLVDLPAGRMKISNSIAPAPVTEGSTFFAQHPALPKDTHPDPTGDVAFMENIVACIESRQGEQMIRSKFRSYISKFTRVAAAFEETVYGASSLTVLPPTEIEKPGSVNGALHRKSSTTTASSSKPLKGHGYVWASEEAKIRELAATTAKIEGWRSTRSYYAFIQDLATEASMKEEPISPISSSSDLHASPQKTKTNGVERLDGPRPYLDINHSLSRLRTLRLAPQEAARIYLALAQYCTSYNTILELLSHAPLSEAGLFHVSLGLWHEDRRVREATTKLLDQVRRHAAGRVWFARLGGFVNLGFARGLNETGLSAGRDLNGALD
ncbi:hypothetical protein H2198_004664 [Neophaeococcomyces mojaviensis]|uniref:Uncharacterized protein n=1 Tax=Neophaeococcomyces mojaviensis TaxID=3383035 RepID=A0ACC3A7Y4_9EURO|nr:hypothetical protein H2198_004664 [Knufia sp. JES_112]